MIGVVSFTHPARHFALVTPINKSRDYDVYAAEIWWHVAGLMPPFTGQVVRFDVATVAGGRVEAVGIRSCSQPAFSSAGLALRAGGVHLGGLAPPAKLGER